jgi:hypothetical protein
VSQRTLHEISLEPFRRALVRYGVAGLLGSYNRLNGRYVCQDPDLLDVPRKHWGWAGFTVPDFQDRGVEPAYPFGHGLGYTSFDFDHLRAELTEAGIGLTFIVRDIGSRPGKAVPQIYVSYPSDSGEPPAQLKALEVIHLQPAEALQIEIGIPLDDLAIFDELSGSPVVRPGAYAIHLGVSSAELLLKAEVQIG